MKVPPLNLTPEMNRVGGMALPFSPDLLWRYPISFPQSSSNAPPSPLLDVKTQMPNHLAGADPRMWSREDVASFLRWAEREFDLPSIDLSKFCMNGKALCMLTKSDLGERSPGAGDVLHNTLQYLLRDAASVPPSPITPHHPMLSPSPLTTSAPQTWPLMSPEFHNLGHLLQQGSSVTLSPAHSEQSGGSPRHADNASSTSSTSSGPGYPHSGSQSDSEDSTRDASSPQRSPIPPTQQTVFSAHTLASLQHLSDYQRAAAVAAAAVQSAAQEEAQHKQQIQVLQHQQHHVHQQPQPQQSQQQQQPSHQPQQQQQHLRPILPATQPPGSQTAEETVETGTNGRLLWDFLQQLLNDPSHRYSRYIAWRNAETGVFKIVDPPGLARLWGIQKNHLSMNYDKMSRALRYYYRVNILRKVQGERHCYQFLRNPSELRSIKNISMLRGAPLPPSPRAQNSAPHDEPLQEEDEGPTDLSMSSLHHQPCPGDNSQNIEFVKKEEDIDICYD